jgi:hypothetical protein
LIYPNPANRTIHIQWNGDQVAQYILTDALEQVALRGQLIAKMKSPVDVSNLPAGAYLLKIMSGDAAISTRKIQILH